MTPPDVLGMVAVLAATGATIPWWLVIAGGVVVVVGVLALVLSRRRNANQELPDQEPEDR